MELIVDRIADATDRVRVFDLRAVGDAPEWRAGAHLDFDLGETGSRAYSLIRWPGESDVLRIAVQREDAGEGGSRKMHDLSVGDRLTAAGPKNDFPLRDHDGPALLLAGGIGVTPLISQATELQAAGRPFAFHYSARSEGVMAFRDELADAFGDAMTFHFDDTVPLSLEVLCAGLDPATHLYVCGPKGMIEAVRTAATAAGLSDENVHYELFTNAAAQAGDTAFEVEIASTGEVHTIPPGRTIIEVLEEAGMDLIHDCLRGDCGVCQTEVLEGIPDHRDVVLSEAEKAEGKLMQICVSRAKSARLVLDL